MGYPLNKTCVTIEPLDPQPCDDCGDSVEEETGALAGAWATKQVMLDLRGNGMTICVGIFCDECAEEVASRLRDSLPDEEPDLYCNDCKRLANSECVEKGHNTVNRNDDVLFLDSLAKAAESQSEDLRSPPGERVITHVNTVPGSLMERVLEERINDLHRWAEGKDFHAPTFLPDWPNPAPTFLPPPEGEPGEPDSPGRVEPENMSLLRREEEQSKADAQHGDSESVGLEEYMRDYPQEYPPCPFCGAPNAVGVKECGACHRKFTPPATKFQE